MKDPISALVQAYYTILSGNLLFDGYPIPVYDAMAPSNYQGSYVLISTDRGAQQIADKCTYMYTAQILIDCVIKGPSFSMKDADDVRQQVLTLINTNLNPDTYPDFQAINTTAILNNLIGINPTDAVFRSMVRFIHQIVQIS